MTHPFMYVAFVSSVSLLANARAAEIMSLTTYLAQFQVGMSSKFLRAIKYLGHILSSKVWGARNFVIKIRMNAVLKAAISSSDIGASCFLVRISVSTFLVIFLNSGTFSRMHIIFLMSLISSVEGTRNSFPREWDTQNFVNITIGEV